MKGNGGKPLFNLAQQDNLTRNVVIKNLTRSEDGSKWHADLEFQDTNRTLENAKVSLWQVDLAVEFLPVQNMSWEKRLKNPLGFTVVNLGLHPNKTNSK